MWQTKNYNQSTSVSKPKPWLTFKFKFSCSVNVKAYSGRNPSLFLRPNLTPPPPQWGILGSRMGGVTGFCHNASLKMHLSCFMVRMKKMNIF